MTHLTHNPSLRSLRALAAAAALSLAAAGPAHALSTSYSVSFVASTGGNGSGSFVWDDVALRMTSFSWTFAEGSGSFTDAALAKTIYSPGSARSAGALLYHLLVDPLAYWTSTNGLLSASQGFFNQAFIGSSGAVTGSLPSDMLAVGYLKGASAATYEMLDLSPTRTVLASGSFSAVPVPEPATTALWLLGLAAIGARRAERRVSGSR